MEEIYAEIDDWFEMLLPEGDLPAARRTNIGRVSMHILNATKRWPNIFLSQSGLPKDFIESMQRTSVQSGPDLRISTMVPRTEEANPLAGMLEETYQKIVEILSVLAIIGVPLGLLATSS